MPSESLPFLEGFNVKVIIVMVIVKAQTTTHRIGNIGNLSRVVYRNRSVSLILDNACSIPDLFGQGKREPAGDVRQNGSPSFMISNANIR